MVAPKPGLYLYPGALYAGAVKVHTIGTPKQVEEEAKSTMTLLDDAFVAPLLPHRPKNAHKGTNGRIALVAGYPRLYWGGGACKQSCRSCWWGICDRLYGTSSLGASCQSKVR